MHDAGAEALRHEFMTAEDKITRSRRGIVGLSIFSTCTLAVVGLFQTGILKHLPSHTRLFNPEIVHGCRLAFYAGQGSGCCAWEDELRSYCLSGFHRNGGPGQDSPFPANCNGS